MHPFDQRFRVYYADTDAAGMAYHANVLVFAERARIEALRAAGVPARELHATHGCHFLVRHVEIDYWQPLRLDDEVIVRVTTGALGGSSCVVHHDFAVDAVPACRVVTRLVCVREADGRPVRIPDRWRIVFAGGEAADARRVDEG